MSESDIHAASQKLELNRVQNPLFNTDISDITGPIGNPVENSGGNNYVFVRKTFVDEEGRKTLYVKNPIFHHPKLMHRSLSEIEEEGNSKRKHKRLRRFFQGHSSPVL